MRVCVVGIGSVSRNHINALIECGQEIVGLCDLSPEKCKRVKDEFGINASIFTDYEEMLDKLKPDAVHIVTPHYLHVPMVCRALSLGIHVLSEKPCAISYEQISALEDAVKSSKSYYGVCQQNRYNSSIRYVKDFLEGKRVITASGSLVWKRDASYYIDSGWRGKWATEGGGVMINQALHTLDILQWICGYPKSCVANITNTSLKGKIEVEDTAFGVFEVEDNANFIISATNSAKDSFVINFNFKTEHDTVAVIGENVIINGELIKLSDGDPTYGKLVYGNGHTKLIADFYRCIKEGDEFPLNFDEAKRVINLILAMYSSNGEPVEIKR